MINPRYNIGDRVLPEDRNPVFAVRILEENGERILEHPDLFGITQRRSAGELSRFLLAIKERGVIIGARCPLCRQILVPAFTWNCPNCNFAKMEEIVMPDVGTMVATPVITYFPPSDMLAQAPFSQGYVYIEDEKLAATTAVPVPMTTRTGVIRPGVFHKGTRVKIIFRPAEERLGQMTDIAAIPISELSPEQIAKSPLLTTDINWSQIDPPSFKTSEEDVHNWGLVTKELDAFVERANRSPRCEESLRGLDWKLKLVTAGGELVLTSTAGKLKVVDKAETRFTAAVKDPLFLRGWMEGQSLINGLASGDLWLNFREGVAILTAMDRLPRSLRRDRI